MNNTITQIIGDKIYTFELKLISVQDVAKPAPTFVVLTEQEELYLDRVFQDFFSSDDEEEKDFTSDKYENYTMDTTLKHIENDDYPELEQFVRATHPKIKVSRRSTIVSLTDELLKDLYENSSAKDITNSMKRVRAILNDQTENVNVLSNRFQKLRKILKQRFGEQSAIVKKHSKEGMTYDQFTEKQTTALERRDDRLQNRAQFDEKDIREIINRFSASDSVYDNLIALQLATGSRFVEVAKTATFARVPNNPEFIKITGLAKSKESKKSIVRKLFGLDIEETMELFKAVRKDLQKIYPAIQNMDNDEVDKKILNNVNRRLKLLNIDGLKSSHGLRKLFANISYFDLPEETRDKTDRHAFIQRSLGHRRIETSASYANVKIKRAVNLPNREAVERKIAEIDAKDGAQDRSIAKLEERAQVEPEEKYIAPRFVEVNNKDGNMVRIDLQIPPQRGNAVQRLRNIIEQLFEKRVIITEKLLKNTFRFGSKTLAETKEIRAEYNRRLRA